MLDSIESDKEGSFIQPLSTAFNLILLKPSFLSTALDRSNGYILFHPTQPSKILNDLHKLYIFLLGAASSLSFLRGLSDGSEQDPEGGPECSQYAKEGLLYGDALGAAIGRGPVHRAHDTSGLALVAKHATATIKFR